MEIIYAFPQSNHQIISRPSVVDLDAFVNLWDRTKPSFQCQSSRLDVILAKVFTLCAQCGRTETLRLGVAEPSEGV